MQVLPDLGGGGGVERGTLEISRALTAAGWRAVVVSGGSGSGAKIESVGAKHYSLPVDRKNPVVVKRNIARLANVIETEQIDLVHARSRACAWSAYYAAQRTGRPFITTFHGTYSQSGMLKKKYNAIMTRGARVIAISKFIADHAITDYGLDPARIRLIYRGVDLGIFDPELVSADRIATLARQWRIPDGVPVVMLPARLTRWKGQALIVDAVARLNTRDICCVFVGGTTDDAFLTELNKNIEQRELGGCIRFAGDCADMPAAYMLADIVVSASVRPEAFGRVIVEAQAMGRPVIAADHGGARETIVSGETGWLVKPNDPDALASAIEIALAAKPEQRATMAQAAMRNARQNFGLERMCEGTLAVYREVLNGTSGAV